MNRSRRTSSAAVALPGYYRGANVPLAVIRRFARRIAEEFHPDKIILFGSYAYGTPNEDSDVDLLVVMPTRSEHAQAVRILWRRRSRWTSSSAPRTRWRGG